jgi:hypothetical protein
MRCTSVALTRDGTRMFASGDLDHISWAHIPRGQGVAKGENMAVLWKHILNQK